MGIEVGIDLAVSVKGAVTVADCHVRGRKGTKASAVRKSATHFLLVKVVVPPLIRWRVTGMRYSWLQVPAPTSIHPWRDIQLRSISPISRRECLEGAGYQIIRSTLHFSNTSLPILSISRVSHIAY